jgi:hypothetical protein
LLAGRLRHLFKKNAKIEIPKRALKSNRINGFSMSVPMRLAWATPRNRTTYINAWKGRQYFNMLFLNRAAKTERKRRMRATLPPWERKRSQESNLGTKTPKFMNLKASTRGCRLMKAMPKTANAWWILRNGFPNHWVSSRMKGVVEVATPSSRNP